MDGPGGLFYELAIGVAEFIRQTASRTTSAPVTSVQLDAALAYPTDPSPGVTDHHRVIRYVLGNDCPGADHGIPAYGVAADDYGVSTNRGSPLHQGSLVLRFARDVTARVDDIGEDHARSAEHVVLEGNALVHGDIVLDLAGISYDNVLADNDVLAYVAVGADCSTGEYVREMPDPCPFSYRHVVFDDCGGVDVGARCCSRGSRRALS